MVQYTEFLYTVGTYWDLLVLYETIKLYQKMRINNKCVVDVHQY